VLVHCQVDAPALDAVLHTLVRFGVRSLVSQPPTLEELFLRHYEVISPEPPAPVPPPAPVSR